MQKPNLPHGDRLSVFDIIDAMSVIMKDSYQPSEILIRADAWALIAPLWHKRRARQLWRPILRKRGLR